MPFEGRFRLRINHGGTPYYCTFDFAIWPAPDCDGVEVGLASDANEVSAGWFPHLHRGMMRGLEAAREHGREWVEVRTIHTHPTVTTARGCERYGFEFVLGELPCRGTRLPDVKAR